MKRQIFAGILASAALLTFVACTNSDTDTFTDDTNKNTTEVLENQLEKTDLNIGYLNSTAHLLAFVAKEEGYFEDEGLNVTLTQFSSSSELSSGLESGKLDVSFISSVASITFQSQGHDLTIFGRTYTGLTETYRADDAAYILITLGSIAGLVRETVVSLREKGEKVGLLRLRYVRPFPNEEISAAVKNAEAVAVLEKDISFGNEGTVYTNVNSALHKSGLTIPSSNYIGGLGCKNISAEEIEGIFAELK